MGYEVKGLQPNKNYWFRVAACDVFDNQGEYSDEIAAQTTADKTKPIITSIKPLPNYFASIIPVTVTDNVSVSEIWVEISTDMNTWQRSAAVVIDPVKASVTAALNANITKTPEGSCYVRAFAMDSSGNISLASSIVEHRIDRTPPTPPTDMSISCTSNTATVTWSKNTEVDLKSYTIYRATNDKGPYTKLAQNLSSRGYLDRDVKFGTTYYYRATAVDVAGNESDFSEVVSISPIADTVPPIIHSISPDKGAQIGINALIRVLAQDNHGLASIHAQYQEGANNG